MCLTTEDQAIYHSIDSNHETPGALRKGDWVFISNQNSENDKGDIPESLEAQTDVVMSKVAALLERSGSSLENAVFVQEAHLIFWISKNLYLKI